MPRPGQLSFHPAFIEEPLPLRPSNPNLPQKVSLPLHSRSPHLPRVLAVVRNQVSSDARVFKTCQLIQRNGFESHAIGCDNGQEATRDEIKDGVAIFRVRPGAHKLLSIGLSREFFKSGRSLRQIIESEDRILQGLERARCQSLRERSRQDRNRSLSSSAGFTTPLGEIWWRGISHRVRAKGRSLGSQLECEMGKLMASLMPTRLGRLEAEKMGTYLAAAFWDLCPSLLTSGADLIHAHELSALLPAVIAGRTLGVPVVYDAHELEFARNSSWAPETFSFWTEHERDLIRCVDGVIAVSEGCATALREQYGLPAELLTIVRNCPSQERARPPRGLREATGLADEVPLLVFVGKITRNRGLDLLLQVLCRLPRFHLACVGLEDEGYRKSLEMAAAMQGIRDRLFFVSPVPSNEAVSFVSQADVSVMPVQDACLSYHHGLPSNLFESAHAGVPIVASALPDMQSFVEKYGIGIPVEGEDPDRWAYCIEQVYRQRFSYFTPEKIIRIRRESSAEHEVAKVAALYHRLLRDSVVLPA